MRAYATATLGMHAVIQCFPWIRKHLSPLGRLKSAAHSIRRGRPARERGLRSGFGRASPEMKRRRKLSAGPAKLADYQPNRRSVGDPNGADGAPSQIDQETLSEQDEAAKLSTRPLQGQAWSTVNSCQISRLEFVLLTVQLHHVTAVVWFHDGSVHNVVLIETVRASGHWPSEACSSK